MFRGRRAHDNTNETWVVVQVEDFGGGFDIMMLIKSISLSGAVSCNLVTRCWRCTTETLFIVAVLLLIEGPGHGLER